jgi:hypothetical protein
LAKVRGASSGVSIRSIGTRSAQPRRQGVQARGIVDDEKSRHRGIPAQPRAQGNLAADARRLAHRKG